jgi:hypothetical protein
MHARTYVVLCDVVLLVWFDCLRRNIVLSEVEGMARKIVNYVQREMDLSVLLSPAIRYLYLHTTNPQLHRADSYTYI